MTLIVVRGIIGGVKPSAGARSRNISSSKSGNPALEGPLAAGPK